MLTFSKDGIPAIQSYADYQITVSMVSNRMLTFIGWYPCYLYADFWRTWYPCYPTKCWLSEDGIPAIQIYADFQRMVSLLSSHMLSSRGWYPCYPTICWLPGYGIPAINHMLTLRERYLSLLSSHTMTFKGWYLSLISNYMLILKDGTYSCYLILCWLS